MYTSTSTVRPTRFGSGGVCLRAPKDSFLSLEQIGQSIPSIFAEEKHSSRSEKFSFIPTYSLLERMGQEGFFPVQVRQGGSRDMGKRGFTKHLINFRQHNAVPVLGDTFNETAIGNAHDGTSAWYFLGGLFRYTCANGMYIPLPGGEQFRVSHRGDVSDVIEATFTVLNTFAEQTRSIETMASIPLTIEDQRAFATAAIPLRFEETQNVQPEQVLRAHRQADATNSLWHTLNRVQENMVKGGVTTENHTPTGYTSHRRSRAVNGISENVKLNQGLWTLAEYFKTRLG